MNNELKVSFYLKRESRLEKSSVGENVAYPIIEKIIVGKSIAQFSTKLKVEERLWNIKSGRTIGKSRVAVELNREINKNDYPYTYLNSFLYDTQAINSLPNKASPKYLRLNL
jgi:hypothetical protein